MLFPLSVLPRAAFTTSFDVPRSNVAGVGRSFSHDNSHGIISSSRYRITFETPAGWYPVEMAQLSDVHKWSRGSRNRRCNDRPGDHWTASTIPRNLCAPSCNYPAGSALNDFAVRINSRRTPADYRYAARHATIQVPVFIPAFVVMHGF